MMMDDISDTDDANGDGDGVWSPDIEQCFREALALYPPCGRRKHILQEEGGGKMYGRNELIARYIKLKTGKTRTRKQVSSHIQVLARRKAKADVSKEGSEVGAASSSSPGSSVSGPTSGGHSINGGMPGSLGLPASQQTINDNLNHYLHHQQQLMTTNNHHSNSHYLHHHHHHHHHPHHHPYSHPHPHSHFHPAHGMPDSHFGDIWADRPIVTKRIRLVEFSAFIEYRRSMTPGAGLTGLPKSPNISTTTTTTTTLNNKNNVLSDSLMSLSPPFSNDTATATALAQQSTLPRHHIDHVSQQHHLTANGSPSQSGQQSFNPSAYQQQADNILSNSRAQLTPLNGHQRHLMHTEQHTASDLDSVLNNQTALMAFDYQQLQQQAAPASTGFMRHPYVKIDYRLPICRQFNKLERIDISLIQDKFPKMVGSEGLFQAGLSDSFFLVKFWADLNNDHERNMDDQNSYFGFSYSFETLEPYKDITCSTKACSYGLQVVEKVEKIQGVCTKSSNGRYLYEVERSPMCEFMIHFIRKLRQLPRVSQMNSVLENFTVLQEITSESTSEILMCLAFVFEIGSQEQNNGPQYHVYQLTQD